MSEPRERVLWLYLVNVTLLATHQVDAAYWEEWDTFRLPGGIEFFLVFNALILPPVLYGFAEVVRWTDRAPTWSYVAVALGLFTFAIHALLLALGNDDFRSAISVGLLVAIAAVSAAQGLATLDAAKRNGPVHR